MITILTQRLTLLCHWLLIVLVSFCFEGFWEGCHKIWLNLFLLVAAVFKASAASVFLIFDFIHQAFFVFLQDWYSMSNIDVIFVIPIPLSLTDRHKSWRFSSLHIFPSNRDVANSCQMTFSLGCSRWLMLGVVRIT